MHVSSRRKTRHCTCTQQGVVSQYTDYQASCVVQHTANNTGSQATLLHNTTKHRTRRWFTRCATATDTYLQRCHNCASHNTPQTRSSFQLHCSAAADDDCNSVTGRCYSASRPHRISQIQFRYNWLALVDTVTSTRAMQLVKSLLVSRQCHSVFIGESWVMTAW